MVYIYIYTKYNIYSISKGLRPPAAGPPPSPGRRGRAHLGSGACWDLDMRGSGHAGIRTCWDPDILSGHAGILT